MDSLMNLQDARQQQAAADPAAARFMNELPDELLHQVLTLAGPHTRPVCHRFLAAYDSALKGLCMRHLVVQGSNPVAALDMLRRLSCLPSVQRFSASQEALETPIDVLEAALVVAACATSLRELHLAYSKHCSDWSWDPAQEHKLVSQDLLAALQHHASSLTVLRGLNLEGDGLRLFMGQRYANASWEEDPSRGDEEATAQHFDSQLLQLTGLRDLHMLTWKKAPAKALSKLTQLTKLAFHPSASPCHSTTPFLCAASNLAHLLALELPAGDVVWHDAGYSLLRSLTQLTHLQVGSSSRRDSRIISSVANLTNLRSLVLVNPREWVPRLSALTVLTQLRSFGFRKIVEIDECDDGCEVYDYYNISSLLAMGSSIWPQTSLQLLAMDSDDTPFSWAQLTMVSFSEVIDEVLLSLAGTLQQVCIDHTVLPIKVFDIFAQMPHLKELSLRHCCNNTMFALPVIETLFDGLEPVCCSGLHHLTSLTSLTLATEGCHRSVDLCERQHPEVPDILAASAQGWWTEVHADLVLQQIAALTSLQRLSMPGWALSASQLPNLVQLQQLQHLTVGRIPHNQSAQDPSADYNTAFAVLKRCKSLKHVQVDSQNGTWSCPDRKKLHWFAED